MSLARMLPPLSILIAKLQALSVLANGHREFRDPGVLELEHESRSKIHAHESVRVVAGFLDLLDTRFCLR